jgi:acetoin utilization deacetylase AcuC-like enzyme
MCLWPERPMVTLYTDARMLDHVPPARHPERPERLRAVLRQLERTGLAAACAPGPVRPATDQDLLRVHTPNHLGRVGATAGRGGQLEADTWTSPASDLAARLAAGAVVEAVAGVVQGTDPVAFCAVRPPGHHARPDGAMGFCLYGNIAVGARSALDGLGLDRLMIVDWDVHHGNGTQEIFYSAGQVSFLSVHRWPFYPGTGAADETGSGRGLGLIRNVPLPFGICRRDYLSAFQHNLESLADRERPQLVLISAGFDAHAEDPIGSLGLEVEDFVEMTEMVRDVARVHAGGRMVSVLEGGYNVPILAGCVEAHIRALGA